MLNRLIKVSIVQLVIIIVLSVRRISTVCPYRFTLCALLRMSSAAALQVYRRHNLAHVDDRAVSCHLAGL